MKKLTVLLAMSIIMMFSVNRVMAEVVDSGTTGDCTWTLTNGISWDYVLTISGTGAMANYDNEEPPWASYIHDIMTLDLQEGITTIGKYAFANGWELPSVTIPNSVITIGEGAFYGSWIEELTIGNSVTTIELGAFYDCNGLISVTIPNSVITIGNYAFTECDNLSSVTIGNSVKTIGNNAFYNCTMLASLTIGNSVTAIGNWAFANCSFYLTSLIIPNSVKTIGSMAFAFCHELSSAIIGSSVTFIGEGAFYLCTGLRTLYVKAENPPTLGEYVFAFLNIIYVPCGKKSTYQNAAGWNIFADIIEDECTGIEEFALENNIAVYPNPATDNITVTLPENVNQALFTLYDMQGKMLISQNISNQDIVSVSGLAAGVYVYNVRTEKKSFKGKIIKQ